MTDIDGKPHEVSILYDSEGNIKVLGQTEGEDEFEKTLKMTELRQRAQARQRLARIPAIIDEIETQFLMMGPGEGIKGRFEGLVKTLAGRAGFEEYAQFKTYNDITKSMAVQLARALGDVGNISIQERALNERLLPKSTDSKEIGIGKIERLRALMSAIEQENEEAIRVILDSEAYGVEPIKWTPKESSPTSPAVVGEDQGGDNLGIDEIDTVLNSALNKVGL
jgi:hypothetical protein